MIGLTSPYLDSAVCDSAVSLVTSARSNRQNVMSASFFAESSHIPVLLRVAIAPATLTHEYVSDTGWFGLSLLTARQWKWAVQCGTVSGRDCGKLESLGIRHSPSRLGVPLLPDCLTTSLCRVVEKVDVTDHTVFVGEIVESYRQSRLAYARPLLVSELVSHLSR